MVRHALQGPGEARLRHGRQSAFSGHPGAVDQGHGILPLAFRENGDVYKRQGLKEAADVMRSLVREFHPASASYGDSMTLKATGILDDLRANPDMCQLRTWLILRAHLAKQRVAKLVLLEKLDYKEKFNLKLWHKFHPLQKQFELSPNYFQHFYVVATLQSDQFLDF